MGTTYYGRCLAAEAARGSYLSDESVVACCFVILLLGYVCFCLLMCVCLYLFVCVFACVVCVCVFACLLVLLVVLFVCLFSFWFICLFEDNDTG